MLPSIHKFVLLHFDFVTIMRVVFKSINYF